jgi:hypothetical protein
MEMGLSNKTIETLIDLVEIKLSCFEIYDRDDRKAQKDLEHCLQELSSIVGGVAGKVDLQALR